MPELSCTVGHHGLFSHGLVVKNLPVNSADVADVGLIPGSGDFLEEEIATNSSSGLGNLLDREAWQGTVHEVS